MAKYLSDNTQGYESDLDNLMWALAGNAVITGMTVAAQGAPNMTVNVAAGTMAWNGVSVASAGNAALAIAAADPANQRYDLVVSNSAGVVSAVTGTPAATPKPPSLPANSILLAIISVASGALNIQNSNISNRIIAVPAGHYVSGPSVTTGLTTVGAAGITFSDATNQTTAGITPYPNIILNSDFARRNVFGLAMPEVFADLSGTTKLDAGAAGSVAGNIFTQGAANNEYAWCAGAFVWRDGRASATFKAVSAAISAVIRWRVDANNYIEVGTDGAGNFRIVKSVGGIRSVVSTVAQAITLNNWYWVEVEKQGTTWIGKLYTTGGAVSGVTKAASTLIQTLTGTAADAGLLTGASISITADQAASQWGGIAASPGGVYVETWLPESWPVDFGGTLGGQAIGYDEAVDSGPIGKQNALRAYIPATSRNMTLRQNSDSSPTRRTSTPIRPSTTYTQSIYVKTSGASGAGLLSLVGQDFDAALANVTNTFSISDAADVIWTRKTAAGTTAATSRFIDWFLQINPNVNQTGTVFFHLPQLEQGPVASSWRNAPADDAPYTVQKNAPATITTASAAFVELDSRDLALNLFCPADCVLDIAWQAEWQNSGLNFILADISVDGSSIGPLGGSSDGIVGMDAPVAAKAVAMVCRAQTRVAAGKHRIAARARVVAGTGTIGSNSRPAILTITATRGR